MKEQKSKSLSRRTFIGKVGMASAAFTVIPRHVLGGAGYTAPSDMINVAGIGVGARGASIVQGICDPDIPLVRPGRQRPAEDRAPIRHANIYALCDVDKDKAAWVFQGYPKAKIYTDWREMLEKENSIDAVAIGTPDHTHACIASAFMQAGKHVYVEKPMCKTIFEARRLAEIAKVTGVVTQVGNQGHATEGTRQTVEWIQSGVIGLVREVHLSTNRPSWPQGRIIRPEGVSVPDNLNYDVWLGPASQKPYHPDVLHFNWRGLWDYGTGAMGDMGAHIFDAPIWALNLGMPVKLQATSTPYSDDYLPQSESVQYEFAARGYMPPVKVTWCDGGIRPPRPEALEPGRRVADAVYYGDKGIIMHGSHGANPQLVPADENFKGPDPWLDRTTDIFQDWIDAIKNGTKACNDFSVAAGVTEIMLLTNIAVLNQRSNITLEYDAANMRITNLQEANDLFHYEYRQGWEL